MIFKKLSGKYNERYNLSYSDLADTGETNRIHLLIVSPLLFLFGILDVLVVLIFHFNNLKAYIPSLIYFGCFTIIPTFCYFYSKWSAKVPREKAYLVKTIPAYITVFLGLSAGVFNFYILGQPYNGAITSFITGFLTLFTFSLSPAIFSIPLFAAIIVMTPGIYSNFGITGLMDSYLCTILVFYFSIYKRRTEKLHIIMLKKQKKQLEAKTFGNFTMLYEGQVVKYSRTKSEELMGYLIYKKGSSAKTKELISVLWGDHADSARYGSSFRNLIVDIKHTMTELENQDFFIAEYNNFRINPEVINCDYYDFLNGDPAAIKSFAGEFMSQYSWAEEVAGFLEQKALAQ